MCPQRNHQEKIHIGELIKTRATELRIGPTELATKIASSKQNIYSIYKRISIDTDILRKISVALEYDFFKLYSNFGTLRELQGDKLFCDQDNKAAICVVCNELEKEVKNLEQKCELLTKLCNYMEKDSKHSSES